MSEDRRQFFPSPTVERHLNSSVLERCGVGDIKVGDRRQVFKCLHRFLRGCPQSVHKVSTFAPHFGTSCHIWPVVEATTWNGDNPWYHRRIQQYQGLSVVGATGLEPVTPAL